MAVKVTEENFDAEVVKSPLPVVVDCWASWCGPCQMMGPLVDELSKELEGKVKFCKVDVDENPGLAKLFGVMSIPMFVQIKNGQQTDMLIGAVPKENLKEFALK